MIKMRSNDGGGDAVVDNDDAVLDEEGAIFDDDGAEDSKDASINGAELEEASISNKRSNDMTNP